MCFFFLVQAQNLFILIFLQYLLFITYSDAYLTYSKIQALYAYLFSLKIYMFGGKNLSHILKTRYL